MDWEDLKNKSKTELSELLIEKRQELLKLRFQARGRQLKQVNKISIIKKEIARIQTLIK
jgi:large subunit ribosomal protein L29